MLRNTIPWLIAACAGSVIIAAYFVPSAQGWQDTIGQWFEVLASFAFVLGGVNLAMQNLQKISTREAGWGYAAVTLVSFLVTLGVGLFKVGVPADASGSRWGGSYQAEGSAFWWLYEYTYNPTISTIFALLAFGQVFGFFGILLALPASAAILVGLRHLQARYQSSAVFRI